MRALAKHGSGGAGTEVAAAEPEPAGAPSGEKKSGQASSSEAYLGGATGAGREPLQRGRAWRYGLALLAVAVAGGLRYWIVANWGPTPTYILFYPAVMLMALLGGWRAGVTATALSALWVLFWVLRPIELHHPGEDIGLALFIGMGVAVSLLAERIRENRREAVELASGNALYARGLLEASLDSLVTISPEGKITDVNRATELVTGINRENLIGTDFASYFTEPEKAHAGYRGAFERGQVTDYALSIRHVSGKTTDVLYNARVYRDERGEVAGVFAAARDVTERKRAEAELLQHRQHLQELVAARTAELESSNRLLEASNKELETFAYSISHDLRTPLRAVDGFSRILLEEYAGKLDEEGRRMLQVVRESSQKLARLIDDILAFSRVSRQEMAWESIDMRQLVLTVREELEPAYAGREIGWDIQALPEARGDARLMQRVWLNLLDNALKFTASRARARIRVGAQAGEKEITYFVQDNGVGFDMQYVAKLFGLFQRLHGEGEFAGTGIGLAVVQRIVGRHGGRVWAESRLNEGATFYFAIPRKEVNHESESVRTPEGQH